MLTTIADGLSGRGRISEDCGSRRDRAADRLANILLDQSA